MGRKEKIQHCRDFAPKKEELDYIINNTKEPNYKAMFILLSWGLREGEASHVRPDWIHVDDGDAKHYGADFIDIPRKSAECSCNDCLLREFVDRKQNEDIDKKHSLKWFLKQQKQFYRLKKEMKVYIKLKLLKYVKKHKKRPKNKVEWKEKQKIKFYKKKKMKPLVHHWSPKTKAGVRKVWILNKEHANIIKDYFKENISIGLQRRSVYLVVREIINTLLKKKGFPHAIRSAAATKLAFSGISAASLNTQMGWATNLASTYVDTESTLALTDMKSKLKEQ